jgi:hypothetical protein
MSSAYEFSNEAVEKEAGLYPATEEIATLLERFIKGKGHLETVQKKR